MYLRPQLNLWPQSVAQAVEWAQMFALLLATIPYVGSLDPSQLRAEALIDPVGLHTAAPRLSWKLQPRDKKARDLAQVGYRIQVGSRPRAADLWDTKRVQSEETFGIHYQGRKLSSGQEAWWRVQVFDQAGNPSNWSQPAKWSVGLLKQSDWKAQWIGFDAPLREAKSIDPFDGAKWIWSQSGNIATFQRRINLTEAVTTATMRITADDQFTLYVNGGEAAKSDGKTDAWKRPALVNVKGLLKVGENIIRVRAENSGNSSGLIAKLTLTYANGKTSELISDDFWEASGDDRTPAGPVKVVGSYGVQPWGKIGPKQLQLAPPRYIRHEFELNKPIKRAVAYGTALGLIELRLNGKQVSDELFTPGWTDYTKRVHVRGYDVTKMLRRGRNAIGLMLGDGWYSGYVGYGGIRNHYGTKTRAALQMEVEYRDGTKATITSGPSWRASTGPTLIADFLMGEEYDARLELPGWDEPNFKAASWKPVDVGAEMKPIIEPFPGQPVRPFDVLKGKSVRETAKNTFVVDLGQNIAGFARLTFRGKRGQKVVLRFAERLNPDGTIYTSNLRGALATDVYICKGEGLEIWQPRFTFHGFQYIEVTGLGYRPAPGDVAGIAVSSDTPNSGALTTSDPMLNRLVQNAWWTQKMNFIDVPTDCPQRDERLGWTGDAQAYIRTATYLTDVQPFFTKWLISLDDAQRADGQYPMVAPLKVAGGDGGPAWADAGVICPWTIYDVYGDKELLARHYPQMKKFVEFCIKRSTPEFLPPKEFHCFGDWLNIGSPTPNEVIYTAYFAGSARILAQAAVELGNQADTVRYTKIYNQVREAFGKTYVTDDGVVKGDSQCAYVLALVFDLLSPEMAKRASERLIADIEKRGWHLSTGFVGTRDIMHVLSKIGRNDVAFRLLHNKTFPSWGFTIANGATSIWERWDGWTPEKGFQDPGMNSFAHYAFGAVVGWMFAQPAGIQNIQAGFGTIRIAPQIDPKLTWLKSNYESVRGNIVSEWSVKGGKLTMRVVVPPNVRAEFKVPASNVKGPAGVLIKNGAGSIGSGEYTFTGDLPK